MSDIEMIADLKDEVLKLKAKIIELQDKHSTQRHQWRKRNHESNKLVAHYSFVSDKGSELYNSLKRVRK